MKFIVKLFPEITIKSKPVRKQLTKQLRQNIRRVLRHIDAGVVVVGEWDKIEVTPQTTDPALIRQLAEALQRIPGISNILEVQEHEFKDLDHIFQLTKEAYGASLAGKTFVVRVKRAGIHPFKSTEAERYIGGGLNQQTEAKGVDLHNPEVTIRLEIRHQKLYLISQRYEGLGGYPLGSQDTVLSLISGGFDSGVASFLTMRRGLRTHFCFFNLGGTAHEVGVKQVACYLWERYGLSHRVQFITVPFEEVVAEIIRSVDNSHMGVILKRMMLRAAEQVAEELEASALVTGEAIAQVSSQTLANLNVIDSVTDMLVLRPLITTDKHEIIRIARQIGTEEFAKNMPEYCGVISRNPKTRARKDRVEHEEGKFDFSVLERAVANRVRINIDEIMNTVVSIDDVEAVQIPSTRDVIIDIRHPDEEERQPLHLTNNEVLKIPFYELNSALEDLDPAKRYLLYCDKGVMSQLHASHLKAAGRENVLVYRPVDMVQHCYA